MGSGGRGQASRGALPGARPRLLRLLDLGRFEGAELLRHEIAACLAVIRTSIDANNESNADDFPNTIEPGMILDVGPSDNIHVVNPPQVQGHGEYVRQVLLAIASAYGISYESLAGDLKGVNFSSGRMGWIESQRNYQRWQRRLVIGQFCTPVWEWFLQAASLSHEVPEGVEVTWTPPRREMIDPTKEVPAKKEAVRAGFMSLSESIREDGRDPDEVFAQIAADNELLDSLGLSVESDPRRESPIDVYDNLDGDLEEGDDSSSNDKS